MNKLYKSAISTSKSEIKINWDEFDSLYSKSLSGSHMGSLALSVRIAIGSLIIKERLKTSDEEAVEQIRENPYLQYFLGFKEYKDKAPFHPTMFVHFRKRIGKKTLAKINGAIVEKALAEAMKSSKDKASDDMGHRTKASCLSMPPVHLQISLFQRI